MMSEHQHRVNHSRRRRRAADTASDSKKPTETLDIVDLRGLSLESLSNPTLNLASICKLEISNNSLQRISELLTARLLNVVVLDVHSIGCLSKLKLLICPLSSSSPLDSCYPSRLALLQSSA